MSRLIEVKLEPFSQKICRDYELLDQNSCRLSKSFAKKIKNHSIVHISATPYGGGVAEILRSQIPLERSFGLDSHWLVLRAPKQFFTVTKKIHNLLQGKPGFLNETEKNLYLLVNGNIGEELKRILKNGNKKIVIIHDPQPLPLIQYIPEKTPVILRLHIDLSSPNPTVLDFLKPHLEKTRFVILSNKDYYRAFTWLKKFKLKFIPPAIDPLSIKNQPMEPEKARLILEEFGVNPLKPFVSQVSRFDPWKDPLGVLKAYYLAKNKIPELQLVLVGFSMAQDDPEAMSVFKTVQKHAQGDPDIHLFFNPKKYLKNISNDVFINALYTASTVVIQKSLREGFGLTITEAMWKGKPVVAGKVSGPMLQIKHGKDGFLVNSSEEAAKYIVRLVKDKKLREKIGRAAHLSVKRKFLLPKFVLANAKLYLKTLSN